MSDRTPADLLASALAADPSRPLVTFYDDATGERIELSAKVFANWVAKTANLLVDGLDAEPGDRVALALPPHWQTAVWLMACWSAGVVAVPVAATTEGSPRGEGGDLGTVRADIVAVAEELLPEVPADTGAREVVGLSLHSLGAPLSAAPPGVVDYAVEIRAYADDFVPYAEVDPDEPALIVMNATFSATDLVRRAREAAVTWQLDAQSRILVDLPLITLEGVLAALLAPLSANGSVIIQRNLDKVTLDRRLSLEHVTAVAGVPGWDPRTGPVRRLL
ncbi:TIGR03089 family protein [Actinomadura sp. HBU206391]|uniref:TIGR03089 family protein n=1 Tax=Actinomadura sp. HBU206391 TaxID=2731692 RepID=UPI00164FC467|nr:TIGR03089 family protein [Actinomadura sp. HBU206391]MBC6458767.1 TIGR03089 family protein [Actinomadura sp. HBU206391]